MVEVEVDKANMVGRAGQRLRPNEIRERSISAGPKRRCSRHQTIIVEHVDDAIDELAETIATIKSSHDAVPQPDIASP